MPAHVRRHLNRCELCLRRLIEAEQRLASVEAAGQNNAHTTDRPASV
jgi:hypothetical protein